MIPTKPEHKDSHECREAGHNYRLNLAARVFKLDYSTIVYIETIEGLVSCVNRAKNHSLNDQNGNFSDKDKEILIVSLPDTSA